MTLPTLQTVTTSALNDLMKNVDMSKFTPAQQATYNKYLAAAKVNDAKTIKPTQQLPNNLKLENITTEALTSAFKKAGVDATSLTGGSKRTYDKYAKAAAENDKKRITVPDITGGYTNVSDIPADTQSMASANQYRDEGVNAKLIEEAQKGIRNLQQKADLLNKPLQDQYDKMKGEYDKQSTDFQEQYKAQWDELKKYEDATRDAIKEIDDLGRTQYKDYVAKVARTVSGRKAGVAGQMSAQGFNSNIIGNITAQIDTQYSGERLAAQEYLQKTLETTLAKYKEMYDALYTRRSNITTQEQTFKTNLAERYKTLLELKGKMAENDSATFQPLIDLNKSLMEAYSTSALSSATQKGYEAEWESSNESQRVDALSSRLHSYLGEELEVIDGIQKPKWEVSSIPSNKLREFAKLPTQAEAYRAAMDWLIEKKKGSTPTVTTTSGGASSSTATTGNKAPVLPAGTAKTWDNYYSKSNNPTEIAAYLNTQKGFAVTASGNTITGTKDGVQKTWIFDGTNWKVGDGSASGEQTALTQMKADLLKKAQALESNLGFEKTGDTFINFDKALREATDEAKVKALADSIAPALKATPEAGKIIKEAENIKTEENKLKKRKDDELKVYTDLSPADLQVVKSSKNPYLKDINRLMEIIKNSDGSIPGPLTTPDGQQSIETYGSYLYKLIDASLNGKKSTFWFPLPGQQYSLIKF